MTTYTVGREKIREYAHAVGETDPRYLDPQEAFLAVLEMGDES